MSRYTYHRPNQYHRSHRRRNTDLHENLVELDHATQTYMYNLGSSGNNRFQSGMDMTSDDLSIGRICKKARYTHNRMPCQKDMLSDGPTSCSCYDCHGEEDPTDKVFYMPGLLHHILMFLSSQDVLCVSLVNRYFFKVSRSDRLWKELCIILWKDKVGMPLLRKDRNIAPFWRTFVKRFVVESMSIKDIKGMFVERPMMGRNVRNLLMNSLEKRDMQEAVLELMPKEGDLGGDAYGMEDDERGRILVGFDQLWFGCYASSVVDSRRSFMTLDELLSRRGFLMHFKVIHEDQDVIGRDVEISLHFHCKCFFDEEENEFAFRMEDSDDAELRHPQGLTWKWVVEGRAVQVGSYPAMVVHRLDNWGWKLENHHVVLLSQ